MREIKERFNPKELEELDEVIRSSYNDFVRQERRNLLLLSSITIIAAFSGVNPTKGSIMGFSFESLTEPVFFTILLTLTVYFLAAFLIYSVPNYRDAKQARTKIVTESGSLEYSRPWYSIVPPNIGTDLKYFSWVFIHFVLPVVVAIVSCIISMVKIV